MDNSLQEVKINIVGRVQAVFLRRFIANAAQALNLSGNVENGDDGSVIVKAQGEKSKLYELIRWCQKGSMLSKIDGLSYQFYPPKTKMSEFKILGDENIIKDKIKALRNFTKSVIKDKPVLNIPKHVVIIPDGNRRWAREKGWQAWVGHQKASNKDNFMRICEAGARMGVKYVTFWGFSSENWSREEKEVTAIFNIIRDMFTEFLDECKKRQIRFRHIGRKDRLPEDLIKILTALEEGTKSFDKFHVQLALDYGGKDELIRAVQKISAKNLTTGEITAESFRDYLDSDPDIPDPDLIIRTSGEQRTSGVLLSQSDYAELYFTDVYFPDFTAEHLRLAILDYSYRTRRFGGTAEADLQGIDAKSLVG